MKKDIIKIFKTLNLNITAETNIKSTDFLDIYLDLKSGKYKPYHKPNDTPLYVHAKSNHPPAIIKRIPEMIERRISKLSYDENEFNQAKKYYECALKKSGYDTILNYIHPPSSMPSCSQRKRNILWFNPPFSKNVRTNVGRAFLMLIDKHFPKHHKLRKVFNRNNVKVSYSCMPSMERVIDGHNSCILRKNRKEEESKMKCNCKKPETCPLNNECLTKSIVYKATVTTDKCEKFYYGLVEGDFKKRWSNHQTSFKNTRYEHSTALSAYIWKLKDKNVDYTVKWEIAKKSAPFLNGCRTCNLCDDE